MFKDAGKMEATTVKRNQRYCRKRIYNPPFLHNHHYPGKLGADGRYAVCTKLPRIVMIVQEGGGVYAFSAIPVVSHRGCILHFTCFLKLLFFRSVLFIVVWHLAGRKGSTAVYSW